MLYRGAGIGLVIGFVLVIGFSGVGRAQEAEQGEISFARLREDPASHIGASVVFAGEIIRLAPSPTGFFIQVVHYPLRRDAVRPEVFAFSGGLFWVEYPETVTPLSARDTFITVMGQVTGSKEGHPLIRATRVFHTGWIASSQFSAY